MRFGVNGTEMKAASEFADEARGLACFNVGKPIDLHQIFGNRKLKRRERRAPAKNQGDNFFKTR